MHIGSEHMIFHQINQLASTIRSNQHYWQPTCTNLRFQDWYVHFASCFYIDIYCIMGCYYTLCHNTYAYSSLFYKVYTKRENAGSWNSGLEKEQILKDYSAQLQKSWNSTGYHRINKEKSSPSSSPTLLSSGEGNLHQHFHEHHLLSNPSSSLVSNSCI